MAVHEPVQREQKTLGEGAVCFGVAIAGLALAALAMQWLMGVLG